MSAAAVNAALRSAVSDMLITADEASGILEAARAGDGVQWDEFGEVGAMLRACIDHARDHIGCTTPAEIRERGNALEAVGQHALAEQYFRLATTIERLEELSQTMQPELPDIESGGF